MKKIGTFKGIDVYTEPSCPRGMVYFMNDKNKMVAGIDCRSKWQRFKDWLKEIVRKYRV